MIRKNSEILTVQKKSAKFQQPTWRVKSRQQKINNIPPIVCPHIAQNMCWYRSIFPQHFIPIFSVKTTPNKGEQLPIEWLHFGPQILNSEKEIRVFVGGAHLFSSVLEAMLLGCLVCEFCGR
jgi:hypothetical protein